MSAARRAGVELFVKRVGLELLLDRLEDEPIVAAIVANIGRDLVLADAGGIVGAMGRAMRRVARDRPAAFVVENPRVSVVACERDGSWVRISVGFDGGWLVSISDGVGSAHAGAADGPVRREVTVSSEEAAFFAKQRASGARPS